MLETQMRKFKEGFITAEHLTKNGWETKDNLFFVKGALAYDIQAETIFKAPQAPAPVGKRIEKVDTLARFNEVVAAIDNDQQCIELYNKYRLEPEALLPTFTPEIKALIRKVKESKILLEEMRTWLNGAGVLVPPIRFYDGNFYMEMAKKIFPELPDSENHKIANLLLETEF